MLEPADHPTGPAFAAGTRLRSCRAEDERTDPETESLLPYSVRAVKQQALGESVGRRRPAQAVLELGVAAQRGQGAHVRPRSQRMGSTSRDWLPAGSKMRSSMCVPSGLSSSPPTPPST